MTTLQNLIAQARMVTNTEVNQFITDSELTYYINSALAELDDILVSKQEDYRMQERVFNIPQGSNTFALPSDFYQLRGVDFYAFANQPNPWQTLKRFMLKERNRYANPLLRTMYGVLELFYSLEDGYIMVIPADVCAGQYRLWYVPAYTYITDLTTIIPSYYDNQAWKDYAIMDCAIVIYNKQTLDPSIFMQRKAELKQRIQAMAGHRDSGDPKRIVNNRSSYDDFGNTGFGGFGGGMGF